jgi:hypothetical protein
VRLNREELVTGGTDKWPRSLAVWSASDVEPVGCSRCRRRGRRWAETCCPRWRPVKKWWMARWGIGVRLGMVPAALVRAPHRAGEAGDSRRLLQWSSDGMLDPADVAPSWRNPRCHSWCEGTDLASSME